MLQPFCFHADPGAPPSHPLLRRYSRNFNEAAVARVPITQITVHAYATLRIAYYRLFLLSIWLLSLTIHRSACALSFPGRGDKIFFLS